MITMQLRLWLDERIGDVKNIATVANLESQTLAFQIATIIAIGPRW